MSSNSIVGSYKRIFIASLLGFFSLASQRISSLEAMDIPAQVTIRATSALPDEAIAFIADVSVPREQSLPAQVRPEDFIRAYCGALSNTYLHKVLELNPSLILAPADRDRTIHLPACPRWQRNAEVVVRKGDTLDTLLEREIGRKSDFMLDLCPIGKATSRCGKSLREIVTKINSFRKISLEQLTPGTILTLPIVTGWTTFAIKDDKGLDSETAAVTISNYLNKTISKANPALARTIDPLVRNDPTPEIDLIRPLTLEDPKVQTPACRHATDHASRPWPFDTDLVIQTLKRSVAQARYHRRGDPVRTVVRVVDTGFEGLGERFLDELLEVNQNEVINGQDDPPPNGWRDDRYGIDAERSGDLTPYPQYYPLHGSQIADLVLGGAALRKSFPDLGHLIRLHLVKVVKTIQLAPGTTELPPRYDYIIDESMLLESIRFGPPTAAIINMSVGSRKRLDNVRDLLRNAKDTLLVVAAGNEGALLTFSGWYPANYGGNGDLRDQVITVAAHDGIGKPAEFTNRGSAKVDLLAPGCQIVYETTSNKRYELFGTSFAAPFVSFTAALLHTLGIENPLELKIRLLASVDYSLDLAKDAFAAGLLNIAKALSVYDDVLELRGNGSLLIGHWEQGSTVQLCVDKDVFATARILKVTPIFGAAGDMQLRILSRDVDGRPLEDSCSSMSEGIRFQVEGDTEAQWRSWQEIADLVPRYFPSSSSNN